MRAHALQQRAVRIDRCLVTDNSLRGIEAAQAAGMTIIGFVGGSHCGPGHADDMCGAGCIEVFSRMSEVAEFS
jgi:beta-phosphoglucomutase-like phosphatase (HAD superfamily)